MFLPKGLLNPDIRRVFAHYWRVAEARRVHVLIPLVLALIATGLEGASYSFLIPLTDALSENSFDSLTDSRFFGWIPGILPSSLLQTPARDAYLVLVLLSLLVVGRAFMVSVNFGRRVYLHWREETYLARVEAHTFSRVLQFGKQYFDKRALGHVEVEIGWSSTVVEMLAKAESLVKSTLSLLAKMTVMIWLSLPLSMALLLALPLLVVVMRRITAGIARLARKGADVERRLHGEARDLLSTVSLVKSSGQEAQASEQYGEILVEASVLMTRRRNLMSLRWPVEETLVLLVVLSAQAVITVTSESPVPGDLARTGAFLLLVQQLLPDLRSFSDFASAVAVRLPKLETLAELLMDDDKHMVVSGDRVFKALDSGISVHHLSFRYEDGAPVLSSLSAEIPAGETTAVVGASGSGKSTFVNLLARLYDCERGTICLDGVDIGEFSLTSLHRRMAIVSQEVWLLNRTLRENLTYGLDDPPVEHELLRVLEDVALDGVLRKHDSALDRVVGDRGIQLSGGQRQRLAVARALLRDPDILILDEATSALDSVVENRIAQAVQRRAAGRTLIIVAHRLSTIRSADQILVFKAGQIVERGNWDDLLNRGGEFLSLHKAQFEKTLATPAWLEGR